MLIGLLAALNLAALAAGERVVLENAHLHYTITSDGKNSEFVDLATGFDYLRRETV
jgi:hypothetical protein